MITYDEALNILKGVAKVHQYADAELVPIEKSLGRLTCEAICSKVDVPPFNNAAMDGYAINSANLVSDQLENKFLVKGLIQAGDDESSFNHNNKHACKIMTGAPMPKAFDLVMPVEKVELVSDPDANDQQHIKFQHQVNVGDNVRFSGTDYKKGQEVCKKHQVIAAQHIMAMATTGQDQIKVLKKIPVAVISTGNELSDTNIDRLPEGKIFNSNEPFLNAYMQSIHCQSYFSASSVDDESEFLKMLDQAISKGVKIIISTGAVSMGMCDFIPKILNSIGAKIHFHKVKVRPGKPILFAELPNGIMYFGLPGNPIAVACATRFFVEPLIRMMIGMSPEKKMSAILEIPITKKKGFTSFYKSFVTCNTRGQLVCHVLSGQGSFQIQPYSQSNYWLVLGEELDHVDKNCLVDVIPLIPGQLMG